MLHDPVEERRGGLLLAVYLTSISITQYLTQPIVGRCFVPRRTPPCSVFQLGVPPFDSTPPTPPTPPLPHTRFSTAPPPQLFPCQPYPPSPPAVLFQQLRNDVCLHLLDIEYVRLCANDDGAPTAKVPQRPSPDLFCCIFSFECACEICNASR